MWAGGVARKLWGCGQGGGGVAGVGHKGLCSCGATGLSPPQADPSDTGCRWGTGGAGGNSGLGGLTLGPGSG